MIFLIFIDFYENYVNITLCLRTTQRVCLKYTETFSPRITKAEKKYFSLSQKKNYKKDLMNIFELGSTPTNKNFVKEKKSILTMSILGVRKK